MIIFLVSLIWIAQLISMAYSYDNADSDTSNRGNIIKAAAKERAQKALEAKRGKK